MKKLASASPWISTVALCGVVLLPIVAAIGFVAVAITNQQLATQQLLGEAYRSHLANMQGQVERQLNGIRLRTKEILDLSGGAERFAAATAIDGVDSAVCRGIDRADRYPGTIDTHDNDRAELLAFRKDPDWKAATAHEDVGDCDLAASAFHAISEAAQNPTQHITAIQSEVRCRLRNGDRAAVHRILEDFFDHQVSRESHGGYYESLLANLELLACESIFDGMQRETTLKRLADRIVRYDSNSLSSDQRLFLMRQLEILAPGTIDQKQIRAEELAALYLVHSHGRLETSAFDSTSETPARSSVQPTGIDDLWRWEIQSSGIELLMTTQSLTRLIDDAIAAVELPRDVVVSVQHRSRRPHQQSVTNYEVAASSLLPGWQLSLRLRDANSFSKVARRRNLVMIGVCGLVVALTVVGGSLVVRNFHNRVKLTRLKNDLLGTVSHELRTPLSSIRLLVDTLIGGSLSDGAKLDPQRTWEYLHLIRNENERLSRLIENFLTFSRYEATVQSENFTLVPVERLICAAVDVCRPRIESKPLSLTVQIAPGVPAICGDEGGLITVLINLIDNAIKYSGDSSQAILVCAVARDNGVSVSVSDHGIGISRIDQRKLFDRFYQVDQTLHRSDRGCGLGLSIVRTIVDHHGGRVCLESELGKGTTFTVWFPAEQTAGCSPEPSVTSESDECQTAADSLSEIIRP
ncbi:sensor histidine kinase [Allorhodopirellula heiligendammensis]|uniref:histidine kinase n=1 Tax=Allorhodopirellula heiligendammensis TaxID=2714739 RepID=A0A5C6C3R2_9BACT|nr:HAMP domain-containing sensor histidine kinase [Allorhodopirellula heiligendammensis]TWU18156.1 Alkaline phosphatase synthesis sensor protein PhoR [Allorhodopirellula heiligendammensis]